MFVTMRHLRSLLLLTLVLSATLSSAQTVPYSFKGFRVGLSLPVAEYEFLTKADAKSKGWMRRQSSDQDFCNHLTRRLKVCSYVNPNVGAVQFIAPVDLLKVYVLDDVVVFIEYVFEQVNFAGMSLALTEKHGPRTRSTTEPYQNIFGAIQRGRKDTWENAVSSLEVEEFYQTKDQSRVTVLYKPLVREWIEQMKAALPKPDV